MKPTGRKKVPPHLEAEEHALRPDACVHCGSAALDAAEELVEEKLHVVKEHQRRRRVRRTTCRCRSCGGRTTPRSLPAPYERSKVTCEWLAWLVHQKFGLLTPLDRLRRDLAERGVPLAMGTLVSFIERAADLLAPVDGYHWRQLLAGSWMATDGTGLKVLVPKLPVAHNGYIELYRNEELAVFQYEADKSSDSVVSKLAPFVGKLTADAEHRFNAVFETGRVIETGCNAHGRRKFRDAEATHDVAGRLPPVPLPERDRRHAADADAAHHAVAPEPGVRREGGFGLGVNGRHRLEGGLYTTIRSAHGRGISGCGRSGCRGPGGGAYRPC